MKIKLQSKKALSAFLFAVPMMVSAQNITIDETNFPDENFRAYLLERDYGKDGVITEEEIKSVRSINVYSKQISTLKGIEYFTELTYLDCGNNLLSTLDVSKNTKLTYLDCSVNQLSSLDMSQNTKLRELACPYNQLSSLDMSQNIELTKLYCYDNQLSSLDVSQNTELTKLSCSWNPLSSLDVSKNMKLTSLSCGWNQLSSLDVSQNPNLADLYCCGNQIKGDAMDKLIESLPRNETERTYELYLYNDVWWNDVEHNEGNVCTKEQVARIKEKGWIPYYYDSDIQWWLEYEGMDEADGIAQPIIESIDKNAAIYNLAGQRVTQPTRGGIYIINGKKMLMK